MGDSFLSGSGAAWASSEEDMKARYARLVVVVLKPLMDLVDKLLDASNKRKR
jgi:hypothetical protein